MRRRSVHLGFAAVAVLCAAVTLTQAVRLARIKGVNDAIASATAAPVADAAARSEPPQATLARALALSRAGDVDRAVKEFSRLTSHGQTDAASRTALYDLGNLYLRRGIALAEQSPVAALPFIELAKQRYRDLLRIDPEQWDARYNLERALRLAPEAQSVFSDLGRSSEHRPNIAPRDDFVAPDLP